MFVDLHIHTTFSDGRLSPRAVVEEASARGLAAIAITDHDVLDGIAEAREAGEQMGVEVVPGIELTADWDGQLVHILGLLIDPTDPALLAALKRARQLMERFVDDVLERMASRGLVLTRADLSKYRGRYASGGTLLLGMLDKGFLKDKNNGRGLLRMVSGQPRPLTARQAIHVVHEAGGVTALAHPVRLRRGQPLLDAETLRPLVEAGLDAIETWQIVHDGVAREHYRAVAQQLGLLVTGGSDCHGPRGQWGMRMGSQYVPYSVLEELRAVAESRTGSSSKR